MKSHKIFYNTIIKRRFQQTYYYHGGIYAGKRHYQQNRLFKIIFEDKKELLSLYNALTGKNYQNPDELEINTIDDVIYMHLKNDMSFILDDWQNLFEQQSTFNPNQPLRGFFYFADLYKVKYFGKKIYSTRLLKIPTPQYIVFYNGTTSMPDRKELRLSDAFQQPTEQPDIEVVAHMLNINYGHNKELMERCQKLKEYAQFIDIIRCYLRENKQWSNEQAISKAIDDCIKNNILRDILQKERLRVMASILSEFDEVGYKEMIQDEAIEDGEIRGSIKLAYKLKLPKPEIIAILRHDYNLSDEEVNQYMQKFWKN